MNTEAERESEDAMTEFDASEFEQARAWFLETRPAAETQHWQHEWDDIEHHDDDYRARAEEEMIRPWRQRSYDGMSDEDRRRVDLAQAKAWLKLTDGGRWRDWEIAHDLGLDHERVRDEDQLLGLWTQAGGAHPVQGSLEDERRSAQEAMREFSVFGSDAHNARRSREDRLSRAEHWTRAEARQAGRDLSDDRGNRQLLADYVAATGDQRTYVQQLDDDGGMAYTQAVAWYRLTQPEAHDRWYAELHAAQIRESFRRQHQTYDEAMADDGDYESTRMERDVLEMFRRHTATGLHPDDVRAVDLARAEGWLVHTDGGHWHAWSGAHALASTPDELTRDEDDLIEVWRSATDVHTPTQTAMQDLGRFGHEYHHHQLHREQLRDRAESWLRTDAERYKEFVEQRAEILDAELPGGPPLDELNKRLIQEYRTATGDRPGIDAAPGVQEELTASVGRLQAIRERLRDRIRHGREHDGAAPHQRDQEHAGAREHADDRGWER